MSSPGRPRKADVRDNIVRAVSELVAERGYTKVTLDDVVERAGTNKPAFYRRFSGISAVVPVVLASRHGTDEGIDTGNLVADLVEIQKRQLELFTDPVVIRGLGGWLAEIDAHPDRGEAFLSGYLRPRREFTSTILSRAVDRREIAPGADPAWVADLLTGPLLMRVILPGLPPVDSTLVLHTVHATLDSLGFTGDRAGVALAA
jgi:AcrR family transcriptional regulator